MSWIYNISQQTLYSPSGASWQAVSGPLGQGTILAGTYRIERIYQYPPGPSMKDFRDPSGFGWWCPITPLFATERNGFGIHPDGGEPGTHGCIGLIAHCTKGCYLALSTAKNEILKVIS